jgi:hypothetical protein
LNSCNGWIGRSRTADAIAEGTKAGHRNCDLVTRFQIGWRLPTDANSSRLRDMSADARAKVIIVDYLQFR